MDMRQIIHFLGLCPYSQELFLLGIPISKTKAKHQELRGRSDLGLLQSRGIELSRGSRLCLTVETFEAVSAWSFTVQGEPPHRREGTAKGFLAPFRGLAPLFSAGTPPAGFRIRPPRGHDRCLF